MLRFGLIPDPTSLETHSFKHYEQLIDLDTGTALQHLEMMQLFSPKWVKMKTGKEKLFRELNISTNVYLEAANYFILVISTQTN